MKIGQVAKQLSMIVDTLRYYEKFGLLPNLGRDSSGIRFFTEKDLSRLRFIQRAQQMKFKLAEIKELLIMRENPQSAKETIRMTTAKKLQQVDTRIQELSILRAELQLLVNLCTGSKDGCPILEDMERK